MKNAQRLALLACVMAALFACSDDGGSPGSNNGGGGNNANNEMDAGGGSDADDDDGGVDDADNNGGGDGGDDDGGGPSDVEEDLPMGTRETGDLCEEDRECVSGLCLFLEADIDQGFCSEFCFNAADCPDESYECVFFANSGSDVQNLCVPQDLCIDEDGDGYGFGPGCDGRDCDDDDDTTYPGAPELCDGADNDCDGNVDDEAMGNNMPCDTGLEGICAAGTGFCIDGELTCDQNLTSSGEICNGLDDDCDGDTDEDDEGEPLAEVCYSGPAETNGVGACETGVRTCVDGRSTDCTDQVLPGPEVCDGVDNDCDGIVDGSTFDGREVGPIDEGERCDGETGLPGDCEAGVEVCVEGELVCTPTLPEDRRVERCDGRDNDCDGETDEDEDGEPLTEACYEGSEDTRGVGLCDDGTRTCVDGDFGACEDQVRPRVEVCNGEDDDCNGTVDLDENGEPLTEGGGFLCDTGFPGACQAGTSLCTEEGTICEPFLSPDDVAASPEEFPEICNRVDDDCDGMTDEDDNGDRLTVTCYDGPEGTLNVDGAICTAGTRTCSDEGSFGTCVGQVLPAIETCNGVDDDCNGETDESDPLGIGEICDTGQPGICQRGRWSCTPDGMVCVPERASTTEVCNGRDDDCDGMTDEDDNEAALTRTCYGGPDDTLNIDNAQCTAGTQTCVDGRFEVCVGEVQPGVEVCDGVDNDCNGETDETDPLVGLGCDTGLQGVCARGTWECTAEGRVCVPPADPGDPDNLPGAEVCNGLDDDCDGETDEDEAGDPLTQSCYDGDPATLVDGAACTEGTQTCVDGNFDACEGQVLPAGEICDGADNDCDGETDEDDPQVGLSCATDLDGVCARGTWACVNDGRVCEPNVQPGERTETCNGADDDCDGTVDLDVDGDPLTQSCYDGDPATLVDGAACTEGTQTCSGGNFGACTGQVLPSGEICDGADNDCDGETDEDDPQVGLSCATDLDGVCARGTWACVNDGRVCEPNVQPGERTETCNGADDDCDGTVDLDVDGDPLSRSCYDGADGELTAPEGICEAGVEICSGGNYGACTNQTLPEPETCDAFDNNCDGMLNEGDPGGGVTCDTGDDGICAAGVTARTGTTVSCEPVNTSTDEVCNGRDDDCDGAVDNGFAGLGTTCDRGEGICLRTGVFVCDPDDPTGAPICDAMPGEPNPDGETCDNNDDNCDGQVDEGFVNGDGVYDGVENCGSCGIDCNAQWPGGPASYNVSPLCAVSGMTATCDFVCINGYEDADGVRDNGCEFLPDPAAIYVSTPANGGEDDAGCGNWDDPCATITNGLSRADDTAGKDVVKVSDGLYRGNVNLIEGIDLLGGHNARSWQRDPTVNITIISGLTLNPMGVDRIAVSANLIFQPTELSGFTINGENAGPGGNSVGLYVLNSTGGLVVRDNVINAGRGGDGTPGMAGMNGAGGGDGDQGAESFVSTSTTQQGDGGSAGTTTCADTTDLAGGRGGHSTDPTVTDSEGDVVGSLNGSGQAGPAPLGGDGGSGAGNFYTINGQSGCFVVTGFPINASPGSPGDPGMDMSGGDGAANGDGGVDGASLQWRGLGGGVGDVGAHGGGGGGGGAAPGVDASDSTNPDTYQYGASGGGGGSGGCGGLAGEGGAAAGGSFAVFMAFTGGGPQNDSDLPELLDNRLGRGEGGVGGSGGAGGAGGDPGQGGAGGVPVNEPPAGGCMFNAAIGAEGGRGGHGGGGGGGAGGVSWDIYVHKSNGVTRDYAGLNTFELPETTNTGGPGGTGGTSNNTAIGTGQDGPDGAFGQVTFIP